MKDFTLFDKEPSELTLHLLRTIAHNFPPSNMSDAERKLRFS